MSRATLWLVIVVSLAHALCHVFELALPSVEQLICSDFSVSEDTTGWLGTTFRVPFGFAAVFAGLLADRFGAKRLLMCFLVGCSGCALLATTVTSLSGLFAVMFLMGLFASIYHPAGLAFIADNTTAESRGAALGWHGIIGSIGIATAPLFAGSMIDDGVTWRDYYFLLIVPAICVAVLIMFVLPGREPQTRSTEKSRADSGSSPAADEDVHWQNYFILVGSGAMFGFIYAGVIQFLPRYLSSVELFEDRYSQEALGNYAASGALLFAIAGQSIAGKMAHPSRLTKQLRTIMFVNAPILLWMALAEGPMRLVAACALAFVHFMSQPIYNSLIPRFTPKSRRSVGYGFSNMACFGLGSLGAAYAGEMPSDFVRYGGLAVIALLAVAVTFALPQDPTDGS